MILFTPGPVPLSPDIQQAMLLLQYHKYPGFSDALDILDGQLRQLFHSSLPILPICSSGTGAAEAFMLNALRPGKKALVLVNGRFSGRWAQMLQIFGIDTHILVCNYGEAVLPEQLAQWLADSSTEYESVWCTHTETSTGVLSPIHNYASIIRQYQPHALICVDAVASAGCEELYFDAWDLDFVFSASQKGLAAPPGAGLLLLSERAWYAVENSQNNNKTLFYMDLKRAKKVFLNRSPLFTPPLPVLGALLKSTTTIIGKGIQNIAEQAHGIRQNIALHCPQLSPFGQPAANGLSVYRHQDAITICQRLYDEFEIVIAPGQDHLKDSIIRIGHMVPYSGQEIHALIMAMRTILGSSL
jgi:aspartate aminotransferase-like enzyme